MMTPNRLPLGRDDGGYNEVNSQGVTVALNLAIHPFHDAVLRTRARVMTGASDRIVEMVSSLEHGYR